MKYLKYASKYLVYIYMRYAAISYYVMSFSSVTGVISLMI